MLRCTIELVPLGIEERKRVIGLIEIGNDGPADSQGNYNYVVTATKTPPFRGALKDLWRKRVWPVKGAIEHDGQLLGYVEGFHRTKRGSYDLLYRALRALVGDRNP